MNEQVAKWIAEKKEASREVIELNKKHFLQKNKILCKKIYAPVSQTEPDLEYPFSEIETIENFKYDDGFVGPKMSTRCYKYETPDITDEEFEELKKCLALVENEKKQNKEKENSAGRAFKFLSILSLIAIPILAIIYLATTPKSTGEIIIASILSFIYILSHLNAHS